MSYKSELQDWSAALEAYDAKDYDKSIQLFQKMEPNSKILFNIGLIHAANGYHEEAVTNFNAATELDNYLAIAYFQCGVSNFLLGRYQFAYKDFDVAFKHLRENQWIDYEQLGLKFKLWSAEVLYNRGLCLIYMNQLDNGMRDLQAAKRDKQVPDHDVIDDAIAAQGRQFTVFSLQEGVLYRPSADKVKNLKTKNYMGTAKLVAASEEKDAFTDFVGVKRKEQGLGPAGQLLLGQEEYAPPVRKQSDPSPLPARNGSAAGGLGRSRTLADRSAASAGRPGLGVRVQTPPRGDDMDDGLSGRPRPQRSNTVGVGARPAMNGMPTRGLSIRGRGDSNSDGASGVRPVNAFAGRDRSLPPVGREQQRPPPPRPASPPQDQRPPPPPVSKGLAPPRMGDTAPLQLKRPSAKEENRGVMTQIYEDYLGIGGGNGAEDAPTQSQAQSQPQSQDPLSRVAAWQQRTVPGASPNVPPSRAPSRRGGGGGSVVGGRRTPSKGNVIPGIRLSGSRDDDDGGSSATDIVPFEQMKIRVKIHYDDDTRGMAVWPSTTFDEFVEMLTIKFKRGWNNLNCKFIDTDGSKVSLRDEMDWEMAIEVARESVKGSGEAKLDMWMIDR